MEKIVIYTVCMVLLAMFIQDFRYRKIHVALPILLFLLSLFFIMREDVFLDKFKLIVLNFFFFLISFVVLVTYMTFKEKKFLNPFKSYFGFGDVLLYLSITPLFLPYNYILFFILSLVFSVIIHLIINLFIVQKTVPLAGYVSFFLALVIVSDVYFNFNDITLL